MLKEMLNIYLLVIMMTMIGNVRKCQRMNFMIFLLIKLRIENKLVLTLFYNNGIEGISLLAHNSTAIILGVRINCKRIDEKHTDTV